MEDNDGSKKRDKATRKKDGELGWEIRQEKIL